MEVADEKGEGSKIRTVKGGKMDIAGRCEPRFSSVRAALASSLERGADVGASVSVT